MGRSLLLSLAGVALLVLSAEALCPNSCSGHGTCGQYDECMCYRNWIGNDCSSRLCPFHTAFVTTPQGDLNSDGDEYDNSFKPIVGNAAKSGTTNKALLVGDITINTDTFVFDDGTNALATNELIAGDSVLVKDQTFVISNVATGTGTLTFTTRASSTYTNVPVYKWLETPSQPGGAWEAWPGSHNSKYDEGHYNMECANRGTCDRETGECACYEGYTGSSCQRTVCPDSCSGHGVCSSIDALVWRQPRKQSFYAMGAAAGATDISVSVAVGSSSADFTNITVGTLLRFGWTGNSTHSISAIASGGLSFTLATPLETEIADWTTVHVLPEYRLWDRKMSRACVCDPLWSGPNCAQRSCPSGDDPLTRMDTNYKDSGSSTQDYGSYMQAHEKQMIQINSGSVTVGEVVSGTLKLTFKDDSGRSFSGKASHLTKLPVTASMASIGTVVFDSPLHGTKLAVNDYVTFDGYYSCKVDAFSTASGNPANYYSTATVTCDNAVAVTGSHNIFRIGFASTIENALEGLPNGVVPSVSVGVREHPDITGGCTGAGGVDAFDGVQCAGYRFLVDFESNPGDLADLHCNTSDAFLVKFQDAVATVSAGSTSVVVYAFSPTARTTASTTHFAATADVGKRIMIGDEIRTITVKNDGAGTLKVDRPFGMSYSKYPVAEIQTDTVTGTSAVTCFATDTPKLYFGSAGSAASNVSLTLVNSAYTLVTETGASAANFLDTSDIAVGSRIRVASSGGTQAGSGKQNNRAPWEIRTVNYVDAATASFTVSEGFTSTNFGDHPYSSAIWLELKGTTEADECSNRGLCDAEAGACKCFTGYTGAACSTQSSLAL